MLDVYWREVLAWVEIVGDKAETRILLLGSVENRIPWPPVRHLCRKIRDRRLCLVRLEAFLEISGIAGYGDVPHPFPYFIFPEILSRDHLES